jgi:hypothetical protein
MRGRPSVLWAVRGFQVTLQPPRQWHTLGEMLGGGGGGGGVGGGGGGGGGGGLSSNIRPTFVSGNPSSFNFFCFKFHARYSS